jgi:hypothetical protein
VAAQYDVSQIDDPITGYHVANRMPGRSIIEALMPYDYFDACESDCLARFVKRGGASVVTIDDDLLGAFPGGSEAPAQIQKTRGLEQDLPSAIDVVYPDENADQLAGTQSSPRQIGNSKDPISMDTAIVMSAARAKQVADAMLYSAWYGRDKAKTALPPPYLYLDPCDVITIQGKTNRILNTHESMQGVLEVDLQADLAALWFQAPVPAPGSGFTPQNPPDAQDTELALLDIPLLGTDPTQGITWVAAQGASRRDWRGMALLKSVDGGTTYSQILTDITPDTIGEALTALPNFGGVSFDESSVLQVLIHPGGGELSGASRDAVLGGANLAMVGAEMIAFKVAALVDVMTYELSGILRGLHGTEWAMRGHAIGDLFCLIPPSANTPAGVVDLGVTRQYKPVTFGQSADLVTPVNYRSNGVALAPYSPGFLRAGFLGTPGAADILIGWDRRSRVSMGWLNFRAPTGDGPPLGETIEQYQVRIWADGSFQVVV